MIRHLLAILGLSGARHFGRCLFFGLMDWLLASRRTGHGGGMLWVRLDAIGDFVMWLECASRLRAHYPGTRITLVVNSQCEALARALPFWDDVVAVDMSRFIRIRHACYRWQMLRRIRSSAFDKVIHPVASRSFLSGDSAVRAAGAPESIGSAGESSNIPSRWRRWSDRWYSKLVPLSGESVHESLRNWEFVRGLGVLDRTLPSAGVLSAPMVTGGGEKAASSSGICPPYLMLFPGASRVDRRWPVERFCDLVSVLRVQVGITVVLCGSQGEFDLCARIAREQATGVVNLAGKTTLPEVVELIRGASLVIGNESSAMHMAAALDTPSVAVVGGGHLGRFLPYPPGTARIMPLAVHGRMPCFNCDWLCSQPHVDGDAFPCISLVSVESVAQAAMSVLGTGKAGAPVGGSMET